MNERFVRMNENVREERNKRVRRGQDGETREDRTINQEGRPGRRLTSQNIHESAQNMTPQQSMRNVSRTIITLFSHYSVLELKNNVKCKGLKIALDRFTPCKLV